MEHDPLSKKDPISDFLKSFEHIFSASLPDVSVSITSAHFYMFIDVLSEYDKGIDYVTDVSWDKDNNTFDTKIFETMPKGKFYDNSENQILLEEVSKNKTIGENIPLYFDLKKALYPAKYNILFVSAANTDPMLAAAEGTNCAISDTTQWVTIPPPSFSLNLTKNPIEIREDESKNIQMVLQSEANTDMNIDIFNGTSDKLDIFMSPNRNISLPAFGTFYIDVKLKGKESNSNNTERTFSTTIPIHAKMSFSHSVLNFSELNGYGKIIASNSILETKTKNIDLTAIVSPALSPFEKFSLFVNSWITTLSGLWSFLAGIATVIGPVVYKLYKKDKEKNKN